MKLTSILQDILLYEGLIHSTDIDTTADMLKKWRSGMVFHVDKLPYNSLELEFAINPTKEQITKFTRFLNSLGWFIAAYATWHNRTKKYTYDELIKDIENSELNWLRVEAKYDLELNKYELPDLYHVSPEKFEDKIKIRGLIPKGQGKIATHPERVYLTLKEEHTEFLVAAFQEFTRGKYNLYKIDIDKLRRKNNGVRFFKDPAYVHGIYTLSNIPPDCLTLIKKYD